MSHETIALSRPASSSHSNELATMPPRSTPSQGRPHHAGPLESGQVINGRYHVIRLLGKGGMGAVYHAWDQELGVGVALKVILPSADDDPVVAEDMTRRFKQELLLARQITHRNVVRIHDIGEFEGIKFISMPYVQGQDLSTILKGGALPLPRALALARQIVAGLAAAHDAGVVHRDLKPANIMIEENDHALLMDFGIARSVVSTSKGSIAGTVAGTIDYMAPEQARGESVDGRADIYAVGLILQEMLAGRRHLSADSAVADLMARMASAPASIRAVRPEVPEAVAALITKCLQPAAAARFQSCGELMAALDGLDSQGHPIVRPLAKQLSVKLMAAAAALIVAASGLAYWSAGRGAAPAAAERPPLSVLIADFENKAGDPIFTGTLEQALGLAIEGAPFIESFPRSSAKRTAEQLKPGSPLDVETARLVSTREGIQVILAGSVALENGDYVLAMRALDNSGTELAAAREEAASKEQVLNALSRLAGSVRRALGDVSPESEQLRAETFTAASLEAARAYEDAQQHQRAGDAAAAVKAYRQAIELDPGLGRAYAGMAAVYANEGRREEAERNYKLAMARIDRMTERERYRTQAGYYLFSRNLDGAIEQLTELLQKYPADTAAMANLAVARFNRREFAAALDLGRKAAAVYPTAITRTNLALYSMYAGDFDGAVSAADEALKVNERHAKAHLAAALAHLAAGRVAEATAAYERLEPLNGSLAAIGQADLALYEGRAADAARILEGAAAADRAKGIATAAARKLTALARARAVLGRQADAARLAQQALATSEAFEVKVESALVYVELGMLKEAAALADDLRDSLRTDPRAYARIIDGLVLLGRDEHRQAVTAFVEAQKIADTWLGRFGLGRAYLGLPEAAPESYASFEACLRRRGEAAALFLDDIPTYHLLPAVHYYMGLAQKALGSPQASESFRTFLSIKERGSDPLVAPAREQLPAS